jgi:hypothetical protein
MRAFTTVAVLGAAVAVAATAGCFGRTSSGAAGAGGQCRMNADCADGKVCISGICATTSAAMPGQPCTATRDCGSGLYCGPEGTCATGGTLNMGAACTTDAQCMPPLRCNLDGFFGTCGPGGTGGLGVACQTTATCLAGLYCGHGGTCAPYLQAYPPFAGAACHDEGSFRAYFEVPRPTQPPADFFRLPFPNDIRVSASGQLDISDFPEPGTSVLGVDLVKLYVDTWTSDFDGFSPIGPVTFRFSNEIDFNTATGDSVTMVDVTAGAGGRGFVRSWSSSPGRTKYSCNNRFTVRNTPDAPFEPKHVYAVILTTAIKSKTGETPVQDPDLVAVLGATQPTDANLVRAWNAYKPLRDYLTAQSTSVSTVAAAAVFTVQDARGHMAQLAADVAKQPAPMNSALTLCAAGVRSPCDDGTPDRACGAGGATFDEIHGKFSVPIYQAGTEPYETPAQGGGITENAGVPALARMEDVCFALAVPKASASAPMPAGGWPLVVHSHGTGGSMRSAITDGLADALTAGSTPAAVFGFDAIEHGARRGASTRSPDDLVFNPLSPRASRDNLLQGAVDILQAFRVAGVKVAASASPTGAAIAFDATKVAFFGHSQGSTSGELALAFSGAAPAAVLSGAGAFLTQSLLHKTSPRDIGAGLSFALGEPLDAEHPVLTLFQSFFDRSDPLSYNPLIVAAPPTGVAAKRVYMSWGTGDTYTPSLTLAANAQSLGLLPVVPVLEDYGQAMTLTRPVARSAVFQYAPNGYDGHFVALKNDAAIADWTAFVKSALATGMATVP